MEYVFEQSFYAIPTEKLNKLSEEFLCDYTCGQAFNVTKNY